jgi:hypothetical protein
MATPLFGRKETGYTIPKLRQLDYSVSARLGPYLGSGRHLFRQVYFMLAEVSALVSLFLCALPFTRLASAEFAEKPAQAPSGAVLTQDDLDFRKEVYVNKNGDKMPYRLFVPVSYASSVKYPLVLWLHGRAGRGSDNVLQLTGVNEKGTHFWIAKVVQDNFPAFVLVPQCPPDDIWSDPDLNVPSKAIFLLIPTVSMSRDNRWAARASGPWCRSTRRNGRPHWSWRLMTNSRMFRAFAACPCGYFRVMPTRTFPSTWFARW